MAKTELAKNETADVSEKDLLAYLDNIQGTALTENEKIQFLSTAKAYSLNPFKREIYANVYVQKSTGKRTLSIIVGYEVYLKRAERTGLVDGWDVEFTHDNNNMLLSAILTIWRKDRTKPFKWEVFYDEQVQKNYNGEITAFWKKGYQQLRKVAISQGFRLCFPDELGGIPYTSDEMPQQIEETTAEVIKETYELQKPEKPAKKELQPKYADVPEMTEQELYNGTYQEIDSLSSYTELGNIEDRILNEPNLSEINKVALIKHCLSRRAELIKSVDQATQTARRLANLAETIGRDNVTAMFAEIIEACELVKIEYKNKKFQLIESEPELAEVEVNSSGIITDDLPI